MDYGDIKEFLLWIDNLSEIRDQRSLRLNAVDDTAKFFSDLRKLYSTSSLAILKESLSCSLWCSTCEAWNQRVLKTMVTSRVNEPKLVLDDVYMCFNSL